MEKKGPPLLPAGIIMVENNNHISLGCETVKFFFRIEIFYY